MGLLYKGYRSIGGFVSYIGLIGNIGALAGLKEGRQPQKKEAFPNQNIRGLGLKGPPIYGL